MNKIYLLLVIDDNRDIDLEEYSRTGHVHQPKGHVEEWILNEQIGIDTISGFKLTEEAAKSWALERCKLGEELPDREVSEKIVPIEKLLYIDHKTVPVGSDKWETHVIFKGYRREDLELPVFGYIELLERPET
ncbi:MAG TPA: hypothetical protein VLH35_05640 [Candidatus Acidoferrales bacterium]|nr:hypothetical protein [Candidatus Acidoferrales bacterium]